MEPPFSYILPVGWRFTLRFKQEDGAWLPYDYPVEVLDYITEHFLRHACHNPNVKVKIYEYRRHPCGA